MNPHGAETHGTRGVPLDVDAVEPRAGLGRRRLVGLEPETLHLPVVPADGRERCVRPRCARSDLVGAALRAIARALRDQHALGHLKVLLAIGDIDRRSARGVLPLETTVELLVVAVPGVAGAAVVGATRGGPHPRVAAVETRTAAERQRRRDSRLDERFAPVRIRLVPRRGERGRLVEIVAGHREETDCSGQAAGDEHATVAIETRPGAQVPRLQHARFRVGFRQRTPVEQPERTLQDLRRPVVANRIGSGLVDWVVRIDRTRRVVELRVRRP